jgi:hypothetical protein
MELKFDFSPISLLKAGVLIVAVLFCGYYAFTFINSFSRQKAIIEPEIIQIEDNAIRLQLTASKNKVKELEKLLKEKDSTILKNVKDRKEEIDEIARIKGVLKDTRKLHQKSSHVYLKGNKHDHHFIKIYNTASDGTKFLACWAMFHPNRDPENLWKVGTFNQEFYVDIIETEKRDGIYNRYAELHIENNKNSETKGKIFPVEITDIKWAKNPIKNKKFSWNPRVSVHGVVTTESIYPGLGLSFFSYGKTDADMDWRFLSVGAGGNKTDIYGFVEPVSWNLGKVVPLIKNAFVGPVISVGNDAKISYGLGLSVPF